MIKHSLKRIIDKFNNYDPLVKKYMKEVLIVEDEKIEINRPQVMNSLENKLDELIDKEFD